MDESTYVHRNQYCSSKKSTHFVITRKDLKFVLGYVLSDSWEEKPSCNQNYIFFNCYPDFSLLGAVGNAPKQCDFLIHEVKLIYFGYMSLLYILGQYYCNNDALK